MDIHLNDLYPEGPTTLALEERKDWIIDELEVCGSSILFWTIKQTYNLILLCRRHKVECLHIGQLRDKISPFTLYTANVDIEHYPVAPSFFRANLKAVMIDYMPNSLGILPLHFEMLFTHTSVWSIIFIVDDLPARPRYRYMKRCLEHILSEKWLCNGSNVMEVRFEDPQEIIYNPPDCVEWTRVKHLLQYNLIMREKCRIATTIFLAGKIKKKIIGKDVSKLIACMIWSTRGDPLWRKPTTQADILVSKFLSRK